MGRGLRFLPLAGVLLVAGCERAIVESETHLEDVVAVRVYDGTTKVAELTRPSPLSAWGAWTSSVSLRVGTTRRLEVRFVTDEGEEINVADTDDYELRVQSTNTAVLGAGVVVRQVELRGNQAGTAAVIFQVWHEGHPDLEVPGLAVAVTP